MAQTQGTVSGLVIAEHHDAETRADDLSPIAKKILDAYDRIQRDQPKAAAAHLVDAVNMIAAEYSLNCGAQL